MVTEARKEIAKATRDQLTRRFLNLWAICEGPPLMAEVKFHPTRQWMFDFVHPSSRTSIEIEGGTFLRGGGRHSRGVGYAEDCSKYNAATALGWAVFRLTTDMLQNDPVTHLHQIIETIEKRRNKDA